MGRFASQGVGVGLAGLAAWVLVAASASGTIIQPGDEAGPSLRPLDAVIGRWYTNASCVAVAPNYVITTRHQGYGVGQQVTINGVTYLIAETINHAKADLRVARLTTLTGEAANLASYTPCYTSNNEMGAASGLVLGGYGVSRGATLTTPGGTAYGYAWTVETNTTLRWGANRIEGFDVDPGANGMETAVLVADFDGPSAKPYERRVAFEAAPAEFDSGGGWFIDISGNGSGDWRVAGLTLGAEHGNLRQTWFADSVTGASDPDRLDAVRVTTYAGWINGILGTSTWRVDAPGSWTDAANWSAGVPNATDQWAALGDVISGPRTVTLNSTVTLGTLRLDDNDAYTLSGTGSLGFTVSTGLAGIEVNREGLSGRHGAHTIAVPIFLNVDLVVNQSSDGDLTLTGAISGTGGLVKRGTRRLILGTTNPFGGPVTLEAGTVRILAPGGLGTGRVTFAGGAMEARTDTDLTLGNDVTISALASINLAPAVTGSGRTVTFGGLKIGGNRTLNVTGSGGYTLAFTGASDFALVTDTVTLNTTGADLMLAGGLTLLTGTINKTGSRTLTLSGLQGYGLDTVMNVSGGMLRLEADAGSNGYRPLTVNVNADTAVARFGSSQHLKALNVSQGTAQVATGGGRLLVADVLSFGSATARLDLADNAMILRYNGTSPLVQVTNWVRSGFNAASGGWWDGPGVQSSAAAADPTQATALGVLDNTHEFLGGRTEFAGETLDPDGTDVLVKYTWWGDIDFDGQVTLTDYSIFLYYFFEQGSMTPDQMGWWSADLDYDGTVTLTDYNLLLYGFLSQTGPLVSGGGSGGVPGPIPTGVGDVLDASAGGSVVGVVPEPATLGLLAVGAMALAGLRRRR